MGLMIVLLTIIYLGSLYLVERADDKTLRQKQREIVELNDRLRVLRAECDDDRAQFLTVDAEADDLLRELGEKDERIATLLADLAERDGAALIYKRLLAERGVMILTQPGRA